MYFHDLHGRIVGRVPFADAVDADLKGVQDDEAEGGRGGVGEGEVCGGRVALCGGGEEAGVGEVFAREVVQFVVADHVIPFEGAGADAEGGEGWEEGGVGVSLVYTSQWATSTIITCGTSGSRTSSSKQR